MNREEASFILANIDRRVCDDEQNEALDMAIEALEQEPYEDWRKISVKSAIYKAKMDEKVAQDIIKLLKLNNQPLITSVLPAEPKVEASEINEVLDKIRAEIEPKCDRINSLASVLPYTAHREIQELLCEIMDLYKAESEGL